MAKVFRLHTNAGQLTDWSVSTPIGSAAIDTIVSPDGMTAQTPVTSIPSPFARFSLIKTAFEQLSKPVANLKGDTIYHRLVSESLDIAQLFFAYPQLSQQGDLRVIEWDTKKQLDQLKEGSTGQQLVGSTIGLFLKQDAKAYNFDLLDKILILTWKYQVIGSTSPATLFSSAPDTNPLHIKFGNHSLFSAQYVPLYERDPAFVEFLYHYVKWADSSYRGIFANRMPELSAYMAKNLQALGAINQPFGQELLGLIPEDFSGNYQPLSVGATVNKIAVIGIPLYGANAPDPSRTQETSDFIAVTDHRPVGTSEPMILANNFSQPWKYVPGTTWDRNTFVPYFNALPLEQRMPPGQMHKYPYLTVSDLLESYIIRLPFAVNSDNFQTIAPNSRYAWPLTARFFEYFDITSLRSKKVSLTISESKENQVNVVNVKLRLPVRGGPITLERKYYEIVGEQNRFGLPHITGYKDGEIVDWRLTAVIYPMLKMPDNVAAHYRVMLADDNQRKQGANDAKLSFYESDKEISPTASTKRSSKAEATDLASTSFYLIEQYFDRVKLELPVQGATIVTGFLLPEWRKAPAPNSTYRVAIDFGTTNTHIEIGDDKPNDEEVEGQSFDTTKDGLVGSLHPQSATDLSELRQSGVGPLVEVIEHEFMPYRIGSGELYQFPTRTVISESKGFSFNGSIHALADLTIPFYYERVVSPQNSKNTPNLKWAELTDDNKKRIAAFLETIMLMVRAKLISAGANLPATKLVWFYPSSMPPFRLMQFETVWHKLYEQYIDPKATENGFQNVTKILESLAPFYYYKNVERVEAQARPAISIDIGGGTTDVAVFTDNKPDFMTSFTFAANAIWGDGYGGNVNNNGFIQAFKGDFQTILSAEKNKLTNLSSTLDQLSGKSVDAISFLFSLENHPDVIAKKLSPSLSLTRKLQDHRLKLIPLLFYVAIIKHIAELMKLKNMPVPQYVTFSGTGSKMIFILDGQPRLDTLTKLTRLIFELVAGESYPGLILKHTKSPKQVTCKGGLSAPNSAQITLPEIKAVLTTGSQGSLLDGNSTLSFDAVKTDPAYFTQLLAEMGSLGEMLDKLNDKISFQDYFGIDSQALESVKKHLADRDNLQNWFKAGLNRQYANSQQSNKQLINETLAFYPLTGLLNVVADELK